MDLKFLVAWWILRVRTLERWHCVALLLALTSTLGTQALGIAELSADTAFSSSQDALATSRGLPWSWTATYFDRSQHLYSNGPPLPRTVYNFGALALDLILSGLAAIVLAFCGVRSITMLRRRQFNLRAAAALFLIVALLLGSYRWFADPVAALRPNGELHATSEPCALFISAKPDGDPNVIVKTPWKYVHSISLMADACDLSQLGKFNHVYTLHVVAPQNPGTFTGHLPTHRWETLTGLHVYGYRDAEPILEIARRSPSLRSLQVGDCRNVSAAIKAGGLPQSLLSVEFWDTDLDDSALQGLEGLPHCVYIRLHNTKVTKAGAKKLYDAYGGRCAVQPFFEETVNR